MDRFQLGLAVAASCLAGLVLAVPGSYGVGPVAQAGAAPGVIACAPAWITGWQAAPQAAATEDGLAGTTLRMIVLPQVSGSQLRLRLSNAYGATPLEVGAVSVARAGEGAALAEGTQRTVTFTDEPRVVIPAGEEVVSDPVPLHAESGIALAVSVFLVTVPERITRHAVALRTSFRSGPGDATLSDASAFPDSVNSWSVLTGLDVFTARPVNALVAVGDSITDGVGSGVDVDERWTDALTRRLTDPAALPGARMVVLNAGISRNRLLADDAERDGDSPLTRFERDVLDPSGATDVVLHIGTNDIAVGHNATEVVDGLRQYVARTRAEGRRIYLTTITPSTAGAHGTRGAIGTRNAVNAWMRAQGPLMSDGVFDFAAAVADPADRDRLAPAYDSGDGLHLSAAGYQALADAVDITRLSGSPCLGETPAARAAPGR
ncbi:GDSL-type esterase/lipase family protein [Pseudonocardia humida]|uniref:SGNH/GDSL hydrolase family protein n=1 Tax=Pseudonocardia humida TaxID=2800819 RepID=A0ABT1A2J0_9PSEU|nr:GDSL-type esterase/lipase family protein [Pseudonocardia humida]MCO1657220.1 SGNH/GDSL hydrolase family protein [Pseudonocardia humida]